MNIFKKIFLGATAVALMGSFSSCSDDVTLDGADAVYIDITPSSLSLKVGDKQRISARVTNQDGKVIETPVTWSIDDESVARLVPVYKQVEPAPTPDPGPAEGGEEEGEEQPGEEGGDQETQEEATPTEPAEPITPGEEQGEFLYYMVEALPGAQGKSTFLRVQLENGKQAVSPIDVVRGDLDGALTAITEMKRSFQRQSDDTVYFKLSYPGIADDYEVKYEFIVDPESVLDYTYQYQEPGTTNVSEVNTLPSRQGDADFKQTSYIVKGDTLCVIYTAPRMIAKAICRVTLSHPDPSFAQSISAEVPIYICPDLSPGFEIDGKRPHAEPPNPSNIKQTLLFQTIDINSIFDLGLCIGVEGGWAEDICRAMAAHDEGWFRWEVEGSSVVVENEYVDMDYKSGFVPYLRVRAGAREGLTVIKYYTPFWTCTCNLQVENYNVSHPVDEILFYDLADNEVDEITFELGSMAEMKIKVLPEASFQFHVPTVTVADPSICQVNERGDQDGYSYGFTLYKKGTTQATVTALDKTRTFTIHVIDVCKNITWKPYAEEAIVGSQFELTADVRMGSGEQNVKQLDWTCSNPDIVTWAVKAGDPNTIVVTANTPGEVSFTASLDGQTSDPATVVITPVKDMEIGEDAEWYLSIAEGNFTFFDGNGDNTFMLPVDIDPSDFDAVAGHHEGTGAEATFTNSFEGCDFNITITYVEGSYDTADLLWTLSGTLTMPNGMKVIFKNVPLYCGD